MYIHVRMKQLDFNYRIYRLTIKITFIHNLNKKYYSYDELTDKKETIENR